MGLAQTGTGKTAAFVLPILNRLLAKRKPGPRALVVAPTRELAAQVELEFKRLAKFTSLSSIAVFGGVPIPRQERALAKHPDVIVACPGRLLDLLQRKALRLDRIEVLVLDEADHMFDMGFLPDVRRIVKALPARRQNLMFSATMPREIRKLADTVLREPVVVELGDSKPAETIAHAIFHLDEGEKVGALDHLLSGKDFRSAIVFLRTKRRAKRLAQKLDTRGHRAIALQGNMSQSQRERALDGFRKKHYDVLVATDIAARGLDIAGVSHVVNFDVPNTPDAYTHRIGRTGRSEQTGIAFTFITPADAAAVRAIEKRLGARIERRQLAELGRIERDALTATKSRGSTQSRPTRTRTKSKGGSRSSGALSTGSSASTRKVNRRPAAESSSKRSTARAPLTFSKFGEGVNDKSSAKPSQPKPRKYEIRGRRRSRK